MSTPKDIESTKLSTDLVADPDLIFDEQALPNATTTTSSEFYLGNVQGRVELKVVVDTGVTLTANLTINIRSSATAGGSKSTVESFVIAAGAIAAGDELVKWIPPRETSDVYFDMQLVTTANESAGIVNAYPVIVS